ncbi:hypothetical protein NLJ89_g3452 [Agrocybe chaxingu]|uniref:Uncharacterized protein n=1 Tax=Agrocybe chaxingu TaxID=84603 RepID=A0A9W8MYH2_9AGAR|nr:hypothetical protein NLJ89_g3452 [Agrocybe chaxingu]
MNAPQSLCPGYKHVEAFGPDEQYEEEEEVCYVTLDTFFTHWGRPLRDISSILGYTELHVGAYWDGHCPPRMVNTEGDA